MSKKYLTSILQAEAITVSSTALKTCHFQDESELEKECKNEIGYLNQIENTQINAACISNAECHLDQSMYPLPNVSDFKPVR